MTSAKILTDSLHSQFHTRLTSMVVTFPRYILAELNTHRMFSRNSASSRAIPFKKMVHSVMTNPFIPMAWMKDHSGMQGTDYFHGVKTLFLRQLWLSARNFAVIFAWLLSKLGLTKQICNRLMEPFMWHTVIISSTDWDNFWELRCPRYVFKDNGMDVTFRSRKDAVKKMPDLMDSGIYAKPISETYWMLSNRGQADIHMMALAEAMWDAYQESVPKTLNHGEWHIPYALDVRGDNQVEQFSGLGRRGMDGWQIAIKVAVARCARVSYTVVGEENKPPNYENDIKLYDRLLKSKHASPFEHCAQAIGSCIGSGNFRGGWRQHREEVGL